MERTRSQGGVQGEVNFVRPFTGHYVKQESGETYELSVCLYFFYG